MRVQGRRDRARPRRAPRHRSMARRTTCAWLARARARRGNGNCENSARTRVAKASHHSHFTVEQIRSADTENVFALRTKIKTGRKTRDPKSARVRSDCPFPRRRNASPPSVK